MSDQPTPVKQKDVFGPHWEQLEVIAVNASGTKVAYGGARHDGLATACYIADPTNGAALGQFSVDAAISAIAFYDDDVLYCGTNDGQVGCWDTSGKKAKSKGTYKGNARITSLAVSADGETLFAADEAGHIVALSADKLKPSKVSFAWPEGTACYTLVADGRGKWLAAAGNDAIIRVYNTKDGENIREMPGHEGAIRAMIFHPQENRLISTGDDRSIRLWYLQGDVEFEDRAESGSHDAAILSMALGPVCKDESGEDIPPRLFTGAHDGSVKIWPLHNKRKPKTLELETNGNQVSALATLPTATGSRVLIGCHNRLLLGVQCNAKTEPEGTDLRLASDWHKLQQDLNAKKAEARVKAVKQLADHLEDYAVYKQLLKTMRDESEADVRAQAATELAESATRRPIKELREALDDGHAKVRKAALETLRALQGEDNIAPLASALQSNHADTRKLAINGLLPLHKTTPQVSRLLFQTIGDSSTEVQVCALDALEEIYPSTAKAPNTKPHAYVFQHGSQALISEVLQRIHRNKWTQLPNVQNELDKLLSSDDESIRHKAFNISVAGLPDLAKALRERDDVLDRALLELDAKKTQKTKKGDDDKGKETEAKKKTTKKKKAPSGPAPTLPDATLRPLLRALLSSQDDIALRAASLLASLQDLRAFGPLLQFSSTSTVHYRLETAQALEKLQDPRVIPCLKGLLHDDHKDVRNTAFESLLSLSPDALDVAAAALKSKHADTRNRALQQLVPAKGGSLAVSDRAYSLLSEALSDTDEAVGNEAFKVLWNAFKKSPEHCLLPALNARTKPMRTKAVGEMVSNFAKEQWVWDGLSDIFQRSQRDTAEASYKALQQIAGKNDPAAHELALKSQYAELRKQAVVKLQGHKAEAVKPLLLAAVADENADVRTEALNRMLKRFSKDADLLAQTLEIPYWDIRLKVAKHLAILGDARCLEVTADYLKAERERIDSQLPPYIPEGQTELESLPTATQNEIATSRREIIDIALQLGLPEGVEAIKPLLETSDRAIVQQTAYAISRCAGKEHIELLRGMLSHEQVDCRIAAAEGLARHGLDEGIGHIHDFHRGNSDTRELRRCLAVYFVLGDSTREEFLRELYAADSEIRTDAFALLLAHEWQLAHAGEAPAELTSLLASNDADIRLAAANALSHRADRDSFYAYIETHLTAFWPEGSNQKEKNAVAKASAQLGSWLAALNADDARLRFAAASLLAERTAPETFLTEKKQRLRHLDKPKAPKSSKADKGPGAEECAALAFSTYTELLRGSHSDALHKTSLDQLAVLVEAGHLSLETVLPVLRFALDAPYDSERSKSAFQTLRQLYPDNDPTPLRLAMHCPYETVGLSALQIVAQSTDEQARDLTIEAMQSHNRDVRFKAAEQLAQYYDDDSLEPMILALQSEHADVRLKVVDRLLNSDDDRVLGALETALSSDDDKLRLKAAVALAKRKQQSTFSVLVDFLQREDDYYDRYQTHAMNALVTLGAEGTGDAFVQRIEEDPEETAETNSLINAMGRLRQTSVMPWLFQVINGDDYYKTMAAYNALTAMAGPEKTRDETLYLEALTAATRAENQYIRTQAISDTQTFKHDEARALLYGLLHHRAESTRESAIKAISYRIEHFKEPVEPLLPILEHKDGNLRFEAAAALAPHGRQEAFLTLFTSFQTSMDSTIQQRAVEGLGQLGDERAFAPLMALWAEDAEYHAAQNNAAEALGRIAPKDPEQRGEVKALLERLMQHSNTDTRIKAMSGMRYFDPDNAITLIGQTIKNASGWSGWQLRQAGATMLGEIGSPDAEDILTKLLNDDDSDVVYEAIHALLKIFGKDNGHIQLLLFDNSNVSNADNEVWQKAANYVSEEAEPVELLKRLPWLLTPNDDGDLFIDETPYGAGEDVTDGDEPSEEIGRLLQKGLLGRDPIPLKGIQAGLKGDDLKLRTNAIVLLSQLEDKSTAKAFKDECKKLAKEWENRDLRTSRRVVLWQLALWSLSNVDPAGAVDLAVSALTSDDVPGLVKAEAAVALGRAGKKSKAAIAALTDATSHTQEKVRRQAQWGLSQLGAGELKALPTFPSASRHLLPEKVTAKELPAATLLSHQARRELLPTLIAQGQSSLFIELAGASESETQQFAIQALARIADDAAIEALDAMRKDDKREDAIRKEAMRAYRRAQRAARRQAATS